MNKVSDLGLGEWALTHYSAVKANWGSLGQSHILCLTFLKSSCEDEEKNGVSSFGSSLGRKAGYKWSK